MKLKSYPEDFVVREVSGLSIQAGSRSGKFAVYELSKTGIGTVECLAQIQSTWNIPADSIAHAGLKDRHAVTSQRITIKDGPQHELIQDAFRLEYLGQVARPIAAQDILANDFDIILRNLSTDRADVMVRALRTVDWAVPNYFDDQRMGSLGVSGEFIAIPWCKGNYERALFLALAEPNRHDRSDDRTQKELLREHWGDWLKCKDVLERGHRRSIVTYLCDHPTGFKKAVGLLRRDLRSLYVSAFQSHLWNEIVRRSLPVWLSDCEMRTLPSAAGSLAFPLAPGGESYRRLLTRTIPLPSGRQTQWDTDVQQVLEVILSEFELERHKLRFSYPRDVFFSRGQRDVFLQPQSLIVESSPDEYADCERCKVRLQFRLKPGQYATMLIKGVQATAGEDIVDPS